MLARVLVRVGLGVVRPLVLRDAVVAASILVGAVIRPLPEEVLDLLEHTLVLVHCHVLPLPSLVDRSGVSLPVKSIQLPTVAPMVHKSKDKPQRCQAVCLRMAS